MFGPSTILLSSETPYTPYTPYTNAQMTHVMSRFLLSPHQKNLPNWGLDEFPLKFISFRVDIYVYINLLEGVLVTLDILRIYRHPLCSPRRPVAALTGRNN
jgi:hypothetical protein